MLIDKTYFRGEILIPNDAKPEVASLINQFIEKYEPLFLKEALGYSMYKQFSEGLLQVPVLAKWTSILSGGSYGENYWPGLVSLPPNVLNLMAAEGSIPLIVDRGQAYDPVSTVMGLPNNALTLPPQVVGQDFKVYQRVIGELRSDEYTVVGNQLTLTDSFFNPGDNYFIKLASFEATQVAGTYKTSPIAQYVYYWFARNNATQTASMGEVKTTTENSVLANPSTKMVAAYNAAFESVQQLRDYLSYHSTTYNWKPVYSFNRVNSMNI